MINSRLGLFTATPSGSPGSKYLSTLTGHPFSRSYGVILPSSLTRVIPARLRIFSPPTCVGLRYGHLAAWLEAFLGSMGSATSLLYMFTPHHTSGLKTRRICLPDLPTCLGALNQRCALPTLLRHPITRSGLRWHWNFNQLSIAYAIRPRLRSRLTLSGRTFLRKPWACGGQDSHLPYRYSCRHSHFRSLHRSSRYGFDASRTLPYPFRGYPLKAVASVANLAPLHFRRKTT